MKTIKDFTPEIQAKIPQYISKYTKGVFDGGRYESFNQKDAEALIYWNYEKCGYKKPVVIVAENIYEAQILFNYIVANKEMFLPLIYINYCLVNNIELPDELLDKDSQLDSQLGSQLRSQLYSQLDSQLDSQLRSQLYSQLYSQLDSQLYSQLYSQLDSQLRSQLYSQLYSQLRSQLRSQLGSQLYSQLDSQLYSQLRSQLRSQLYSQLYSQLGSQLGSQLYSQLRSQLRSQLDSQLGKYNVDYLFTSNVWSIGIIAWYKFIKDEFNIESQIGVDLDSWNNLYEKSGIYSAIFSELVCVVSKYPKNTHRNQNNDLHSVSQEAVEWGNSTDITSFGGCYINGRNIPENIFKLVVAEKYTTEDFFKESNEEIKSAVIALIQEKFGEEYLFNFLRKELKEVDTYVDKKDTKYLQGTTESTNVGVYTLFKGVINNENVAYVRCYCPSTDRIFFLGVDPKYPDAKNAIASLYRVPVKLRNHILYIQRQGERFSTVFDKQGNDILKSLNKSEIANTTAIAGEEYFKKMRYEY